MRSCSSISSTRRRWHASSNWEFRSQLQAQPGYGEAGRRADEAIRSGSGSTWFRTAPQTERPIRVGRPAGNGSGMRSSKIPRSSSTNTGRPLIGLHMHIGSVKSTMTICIVSVSMLDAVRRANRPPRQSGGRRALQPHRSGNQRSTSPRVPWHVNTTRLEAERITGSRMRLELEPGRYP